MADLHPEQFGEQLRMFIPAGEIHDTFSHGDLIPKESVEHLYQEKNHQNRENRMDKVFNDEGIKTPIEVWHFPDQAEPEVLNGHHRLAHAFYKDPTTEVPVEHFAPRNPELYRKRRDA